MNIVTHVTTKPGPDLIEFEEEETKETDNNGTRTSKEEDKEAPSPEV